jgi:uncharacterized membrane protein YeaQ/YmgE (transglycosylase-associated protein family)
MRADPIVTFLVLLAIGIVAGFIVQARWGPSWLSRQFGGQNRGLVTSALIGIAGSFVGYHLALVLGLTGAIVPFIVAIVGAGATLWGSRMAP